jgi:hypothetical protein
VLARAAQTTWPLPSGAQLGAEVMTPARLFQPAQDVPLNWFTSIMFVKPRAAQIAPPPERGAQDGSELTALVPIETNEPQVAIAGCGRASTNSRVRETAKRTFMFNPPEFGTKFVIRN